MATHQQRVERSHWSWKDALILAVIALSWLAVSGVAVLPK